MIESGTNVRVGPAQVLGLEPDGRPRIRPLDDPTAVLVADWAIPFRYEPATGELLLTIRGADRAWITGIVNGSGASRLAFVGDVTLHGADKVAASGAGGVRVDAPEVAIRARDVHCESVESISKLGDVDSEARTEIDERAGACDRTIDGDDDQVAARHRTVAHHGVKIDGELLRLS